MIDITLGYQDAKQIDMWTMIKGQHPPQEAVLYYRIYPVADIPTDTEGFTKWMYDRYQEKDHLLQEFYATGHFPEPYGNPEEKISTIKKKKGIKFSTLAIIRDHVFMYILSTLPLYCIYSLYAWLTT